MQGKIDKNETVRLKLPLTCYTDKVEMWDVEQPSLYELKTELIDNGNVVDEKVVTFGYRKAIFKKDGFYLKWKKVKDQRT